MLVDRVILLHDIDSSDRIGMQQIGSRFLLSWDVVQKGIETAEKGLIEFDPLNESILKEKKRNIVRITVDDGGGSSIEIGEKLAQKNIKAYFFIATKFIGQKGFLTKTEINELNQMGHVIGSHSHTHPNPFCELSEAKIIDEVQKSKTIIEDVICEKVGTFAVPGGEIRNDTLSKLCDGSLGLDEIYISTPYQGQYFFSSKFNTTVYGRITIERNMSYKKICDYLTGKGWRFALINYQVRRLRRELVYKKYF